MCFLLVNYKEGLSHVFVVRPTQCYNTIEWNVFYGTIKLAINVYLSLKFPCVF